MKGDRQPFSGWGFVNLQKPQGITSHDCIYKLRRLLQLKKIGHGGTLDPMATGVLPMAVGRATRLIPYLPKVKAYRGVVRFGLQTATDDLEGAVIAEQPCPDLTLEAVKKYLPEFIGKISQIPPAYSAIQRNGKRLYELARQGLAVDVPSRQVDIYSLQVLAWHDGDFPELHLDIRCGQGTYIRAIARDLGERVGTGATLAGLTRTLSGGFSVENSLTLEDLATQIDAKKFQCLSPDQALQHLPKLTLDTTLQHRWSCGQKLPWSNTTGIDLNAPIAVYSRTGDCLGIGKFRTGDSIPILAPKIVLEPQ